MDSLTITGYEQDGNCEHCGRPLVHCIRLADGRVVGATCFDKKLTKPRLYRGKNYRVGAEGVIRLAKIAQFVPASRWDIHGVSASLFKFEAA